MKNEAVRITDSAGRIGNATALAGRLVGIQENNGSQDEEIKSRNKFRIKRKFLNKLVLVTPELQYAY